MVCGWLLPAVFLRYKKTDAPGQRRFEREAFVQFVDTKRNLCYYDSALIRINIYLNDIIF